LDELSQLGPSFPLKIGFHDWSVAMRDRAVVAAKMAPQSVNVDELSQLGPSFPLKTDFHS